MELFDCYYCLKSIDDNEIDFINPLEDEDDSDND